MKSTRTSDPCRLVANSHGRCRVSTRVKFPAPGPPGRDDFFCGSGFGGGGITGAGPTGGTGGPGMFAAGGRNGSFGPFAVFSGRMRVTGGSGGVAGAGGFGLVAGAAFPGP